MSGFRYAVLGGGRQGEAAAIDLALRGDATEILIADLDLAAARRVAERVAIVGGDVKLTPVAFDVSDHSGLVRLLDGLDCLLSAVPYSLNLAIARAAVASGTHMCDLGGNTAIVKRQLELHAQAREKSVCIVPDCGQVPGMGTSLMVYALEQLHEPLGVKMWDGGIPVAPTEPWRYELTFHIAGLTNEYDGKGVFLRGGEIVEVDCFDPTGYELVDFPPPFGRLEAFVTAGGTSTAPWTFAGKLDYFENRTIRYPGHAAQWKAYVDAGLFGLEPIEVDGQQVVPRRLLHTLLEPRLRAGDDFRDAVLIRVVATGSLAGRPSEVQVDLMDCYDEAMGLTAMQRTTGWDLAIIAGMMARGEVTPGAVPREVSVDRRRYVEELRKRGFALTVETRSTAC